MISGSYKIGWPRQLYLGQSARDIKPLGER
jgi:hypothetical protein